VEDDGAIFLGKKVATRLEPVDSAGEYDKKGLFLEGD